MSTPFRIAAITDEFSPDIETALHSMADIGMTGAELRMVFGKNIIDLTGEELDRAIAIVRDAGMEIISIASPLLKCVLPDAPEIDSRYQQDIFASTIDSCRVAVIAARAFEIAIFLLFAGLSHQRLSLPAGRSFVGRRRGGRKHWRRLSGDPEHLPHCDAARVLNVVAPGKNVEP